MTGAPDFIRGGQGYWKVHNVPHVRKLDGQPTMLTVWKSFCAKCGGPFETTISAADERGPQNRRCFDHRAPGRAVERRKRKKKK
ncbi:hypothetical protein SAMN05444169_3846 [Bradyrhizobium erythrophlei]|uniref:Uncharacterized protein n=1 Tax=Bradyrhizobium erythrophlei TaxID=1437360 RepID=A0A1M5M778_9BRAD|nr:hypothetical protein SAMN05444169_3846 [Bradyrhizobium erythrophlei]